MDAIDLDAARKAVCAWLDEHRDGTLAQLAKDLKGRYPAHPGEMAVILRGMMGRYGQYTALVPPGAIPGESREIIVTSPDLCGLMDELDDLFGLPGTGLNAEGGNG